MTILEALSQEDLPDFEFELKPIAASDAVTREALWQRIKLPVK